VDEPNIDPVPVADILPGLTDERVMELSYATLDQVLRRLERGMDVEAIAVELGLSPERVRYVETLTRRAGHLRASPRIPQEVRL